MADQASLDGMPERLFRCSPSRLTTWVDCPRRYRLQYVEGRRSPAVWAHQSLGTSVHLALRDWFDLPVAQRTPEAGADLLARHWIRAGYRDDAQGEEFLGRASTMVSDYLRDVDPALEPVARERVVSFTTQRLTVSGQVDRVDSRVLADGESAVVVDYKTGRRPLDDDEARTSLALALYVLGVRRTLRRPCTRVELHHLPTATVVVHEHDDSSLERHVSRAESIGRDASRAEATVAAHVRALRDGEADAIAMADEVFPAQPGPLCAWCDMRQWCDAGRTAAPARRSWDGLAEDVSGDVAD